MNRQSTLRPEQSDHAEVAAGQETEKPPCGVMRPAHSALSALVLGQRWV
jgi:hypothetical protein